MYHRSDCVWSRRSGPRGASAHTPATAEKRATEVWCGRTVPVAQYYSSSSGVLTSTGVRTLTIVTEFPFELNSTDVM